MKRVTIDYTHLAHPKDGPYHAAVDRRGSEAVKARSGGRCEVWEDRQRCGRRAVHVHHLLSGIGVRGRGASALAANKLHLCVGHHEAMHARRLVRNGDEWRRTRGEP